MTADSPSPSAASGQRESAARESRRRDGWAYNARIGLILFFVYLAMYVGFVGLAVVDPAAMGRPAVAGVNLAVVYGFGLILAAFVLALVYMVLCKPEAPVAADVADLTEGQLAETAEGEANP